MKKIFAALVLSLPFAAYAQDQFILTDAAAVEVPAVDTVTVDTVVDPYANFYGRTIASVYNEGLGYQKKRNYVKALPCFRYVADQGNADAQFRTAYIYHYGLANDVKDDEQAIKYWSMASEQNHGQAQFELGLLFYNHEDFTNAIKFWELSLDNGYTEAMSNIGQCYDQGLGVDCDEVKALEWFNRAAENGDKVAIHNIGIYYEQGKGGLPVDIDKAIEWYSKAWSLGYYNSKVALDRIQANQ